MGEGTVVSLPKPGASVANDPLLAVLREGARRMLTQAVEAEVEAWFCQNSRQPGQRWSRRRGDGRLCGPEDTQHGHGPAEEEEQSAVVGGDMLVVAGAEAEEVAELVVTSAEPGG